jgi:serine/threonine protein kinase
MYKLSDNITRGMKSDLYLSADRNYIVKKLHYDKYKMKMENDTILKLIKNEIMLLTLVEHENIVKIQGYNIFNNIYFLKLEKCDYDVEKMLKSIEKRNLYGGCEIRIIKQFLNEIGDALYYLHQMNIIHRDIKLSNILVVKKDEDVKFKISDFGFSCINQSLYKNGIMENNFKKLFYLKCGTPCYMAPELIKTVHKKDFRLMNYDYKVDIWSLGIAIYELLTRKRIFDTRNINEHFKIFSELTSEELQKMINLKIYETSSEFDDILKNMICVNRHSRYSSTQLKNEKIKIN